MNLYLIVFFILGLGAIGEWFRPQYSKKIYRVCWILMTAVLCFRYGQGTDYMTYHTIYETVPCVVDLPHAYFFGVYPVEIGWRVLNLGFRLCHVPFWGFVMILGLAEMLLLHRFLEKHISWKTAGLFLCYPVLFLVYLVSGLRQGLVMCLFLGIGLEWYLQRKWIRYVLLILVLSLFHRGSLVWLILIPISYLPMSAMLAALAGAVLIGGLLLIPGIQQMLMNIPVGLIIRFFEEGNLSYLAIGERLFSCLLVLFLYKMSDETKCRDKRLEHVLKAYLCGVCIYMLLLSNSYYASRFACMFKILECVMIVQLLQERKWIQTGLAICFFSLTLIMGVKNMNAMIEEGGYDTARIHVWNYPYVSIFHPEKINEYLPYEEEWQRIYYWSDMYQEIWRLEEDDYLCDWKFWLP